MAELNTQVELLEQKHAVIDIQKTQHHISNTYDDCDDNTQCTLCEKQFDYIDLNKCDKCIEIFCDECFYGYETHDSNCKVIDYEIGHEC